MDVAWVMFFSCITNCCMINLWWLRCYPILPALCRRVSNTTLIRKLLYHFCLLSLLNHGHKNIVGDRSCYGQRSPYGNSQQKLQHVLRSCLITVTHTLARFESEARQQNGTFTCSFGETWQLMFAVIGSRLISGG